MKKIIFMMIAMMAMTFAVQAKTVKTSFKVNGVCDQLCKPRIQNAAKSVKGVLSASWDSKTKVCKVVFDDHKTSKEKIEKAITTAGHDAGNFKASDAAYNKLPGCCKYRSAGKKGCKM